MAMVFALTACKPETSGYIDEPYDGPFAYELPTKWVHSPVPTPEHARDYMRNREVPAYTCAANDCGADTVLLVSESFLLWRLSSEGLESVQSADDLSLVFDKIGLLASAIGSKPEGVKIFGHHYDASIFAGYPAVEFEVDMKTPERTVKVVRKIICAPRYCVEFRISAPGASSGQLLDLIAEVEPTLVLGEPDPAEEAMKPGS
jgi:hypothetical protein